MANALPLYEPFSPRPFDYGRRKPIFYPHSPGSNYPRRSGYDYGRKPRGYRNPRRGNSLGRGPRVTFPSGPAYQKPVPLFHGVPKNGTPFGRRAFHSVGRSASVPWKDIFRRFGGAVGGALVVYEGLEALHDYATALTPLENPQWRESAYAPFDRYTVSLPDGWGECSWYPLRSPGRTLSGGRVKRVYTQPSMLGNMSALSNVSGACARYGNNNEWQEGVGQSFNGDTYTGFYTRDWSVPNARWEGNIVPWWIFATDASAPAAFPKAFVTPQGVPAVDMQVLPVTVAPPSLLDSLLPASRPVAAPAAHPQAVPRWLRPYVRQSQLGKTATNGETVSRPNPDPYPRRAPRGTKERKRKWAGMGALSAAKNVLNTTLETCDAIDEIWSALPGHVKWTAGLGRGKNCYDKGRDIYSHFHELDIDQAVWNLVKMYGEDWLYGKYFATSDKVAKRLGFPGWKLDQPITEVLSNLPEDFKSGLLDDIGNTLFGLMKGR